MEHNIKNIRRQWLRIGLFVILILSAVAGVITSSFFVNQNARSGPITGGTYEAIVRYKNAADSNDAVKTFQDKIDPLLKKRMDIAKVGDDQLDITVPRANYNTLMDFLRDIERRGSIFFLNDKGQDLLVGIGKGKDFKIAQEGDGLERVILKDLIDANSFSSDLVQPLNKPMVKFKVKDQELFSAVFKGQENYYIWTDIGQMLDEMRNNYNDIVTLRNFMDQKIKALSASEEKRKLETQYNRFLKAKVTTLITGQSTTLELANSSISNANLFQYFDPKISKIEFLEVPNFSTVKPNDDLTIDINDKTDTYNKQATINVFRPYLKELVDTYKSVNYSKYLISLNPVQVVQKQTDYQYFTVDGEEKATGLAKIMSAGVKGIAYNPISYGAIPPAVNATLRNVIIIITSVILLLALVFLTISYRLMGVLFGLILALAVIVSMIVFNVLLGIYGWEVFAAILLGLIVALSSTIILLERMKEEFNGGKNIVSAFKDANRKSISTVFDISILTLATSIFMFWFGASIIKSFAIMLIIMTIAVMVFVIIGLRLLYYAALSLPWISKNEKLVITNLTGINSFFIKIGNILKLNQVKIWINKVNWQKTAKWFLLGSIAIITVGAITLGVAGTGRSLDFSQGTIYQIEMRKTSSIVPGELEDQLEKIKKQINNQVRSNYGRNTIEVRILDSAVNNQKFIVVKTSLNSFDNISNLNLWFEKDFSPTLTNFTVSRVNYLAFKNQTSSQIVITGLIAFGISLAVVVAYLIVRFDWSFIGPMLITVVQDVLLLSAFLVIFRFPIGIEVVVAVLTITIFSIIHKMVIFDRVRENKIGISNDELKKPNLIALINQGFWLTFKSSMIVLLLTFLMLIAMFALGYNIGATFALLLGIMISIYSSGILLRWLWGMFAYWKLIRYQKKKTKIYRSLNMPDEQIIEGIND